MPLESLAQAMNRISAEVRGGPLTRMARGGPVMKAYEPSWRDRIASALMGDERASPERRNFVQGLMGSTGLGTTGLGVADLVPGGQVLGAQEAAREGDYKGAAMAMMPGARAVAPIEREALRITNPIRAYHGSPHDFDKFDLSKIGTGEGAQAYGHGLYFAEREGVAKEYRDALSNVSDWTTDKAIKFLREAGGDRKLAAANVDKYLSGGGLLPETVAGFDLVKSLLKSDTPLNTGRMYEVNIHADPNAFLDWDKRLREQPPAVLDAIKNVMPSGKTSWGSQPSTGSEIYKAISAESARGRPYATLPSEGSAALREAGIPGIKYLDQGSRAAGEGSRNYVVFDDRVIEIARKYGIPLAAASALLYGNQDQAVAAEKAEGGPVHMADGGAIYDLMGNVAVPPSEGFAPAPAYENIADAMAKAGAAVGRPATTVLRGASEIPGTIGDYFAEKSGQPDPSQRIAEDITSFGSKMIEGAKQDPVGFALDVAPIVGEIRSGMEADELITKAEAAEAVGDFDKAKTFRQLAAVAAAGAAPIAGTAARLAKRGAKIGAEALEAGAKVGADVAETGLKQFDVQAFSPKPVAEAFEQSPAPNVMRDDIIAEITRSIDATDGSAAKLPTTAGLGPMYVVDSGVKPEGKGFLLNETKNANAEKQLSGIDPLFEKYPDIATNPDQWAAVMAEATGKSNVLAPPYRFMKELAPGGDYENLLKTMTPGQITDRQRGFENGKKFLESYSNGDMFVEDTGKLFMWGMLSRGVDPFTHEGLFLDAFNGIEPWVKMAAEGKFTKEVAEGPYKEWASTVSPKGSGQAGSGAVHNLNAFGRDFLTKMGTPDAGGVTPLQKLHDLMSDPTKSGREIRREFAKTGEGVGIDNKVVSFILLATGRDDVMVIDRIQLKNLWDDGRFGDVNIWDGISVPVVKMADGKTKRFPPTDDGRVAAREFSAQNKGSKVENAAVTGSALAEATYGAKGILVYEALEDALTKSVKDLYARAGLNEANPTPGMFHWDTWVARSNQEASHGTLGAILSKRQGKQDPLSDVYSKQGDYQTYAYGAKYGVSPEGAGFYRYPLSTGEEVVLAPAALAGALENVKNPKYGVVPKGFKVTETTGRPWYEREGVNRAKLDELIRAAAGSGGAGGQTQSPIRRASGGAVSDVARDGVGRDGTGRAGRAEVLKLAAEHGLHRPQIAHALRQKNPRLTPEAATDMAKRMMSGEQPGLHDILSDKLMKDLRQTLRDHHVRGRS